MKSENQINADNQQAVSDDTSGTRRKLIRGGVIGAPILLALKSTPVMACNCKLPSGFSTSGNLSRNNGAGELCEQPARSPANWVNRWDSNGIFLNTVSSTNPNGINKNTKFKNIFGGSDETKFKDVLLLGNFASLVVAAYLNIAARAYVGGVTSGDILAMWGGTYKPPSSTKTWTKFESENYLRYTMGLPILP